MNERAFAILRIMEQHAPDTDHPTLQAAAIAVDAIYADAQRSQPSWFFMDGYKRELRRGVRKALADRDLPNAKNIRDEAEAYAIHAYAEPH